MRPSVTEAPNTHPWLSTGHRACLPSRSMAMAYIRSLAASLGLRGFVLWLLTEATGCLAHRKPWASAQAEARCPWLELVGLR